MARGLFVVTERTVELRDGALAFRVLHAGRGAPLLAFHSFNERGGWPPMLDRLAQRYAVYAPFHPGVQGSRGVESLDDVLDLVLAYDELLTALALDRVHVFGHFFGGMVAAELTALFPARVDRMVLAAPLGLWRDEAPIADVLILPPNELASALWTDPSSAVARQWIELPTADEDNVAAQIEAVQRRAAIAKFVWPIPERGITKRLHRVTAPTLLLWGDDDRVNPVSYAEEWQRRIKGAALRLLRGGHMAIHEQADLAARVIEAFLA